MLFSFHILVVCGDSFASGCRGIAQRSYSVCFVGDRSLEMSIKSDRIFYHSSILASSTCKTCPSIELKNSDIKIKMIIIQTKLFHVFNCLNGFYLTYYFLTTGEIVLPPAWTYACFHLYCAPYIIGDLGILRWFKNIYQATKGSFGNRNATNTNPIIENEINENQPN